MKCALQSTSKIQNTQPWNTRESTEFIQMIKSHCFNCNIFFALLQSKPSYFLIRLTGEWML